MHAFFAQELDDDDVPDLDGMGDTCTCVPVLMGKCMHFVLT